VTTESLLIGGCGLSHKCVEGCLQEYLCEVWGLKTRHNWICLRHVSARSDPQEENNLSGNGLIKPVVIYQQSPATHISLS